VEKALNHQRSIAEELRSLFESLTPTERKVGRVLLANYPVAGLETIAQLAARADVSGPTVLRLISKLGYDSYSAFQTALRDELEVRLQSPLVRHDPAQLQGDHDFLVGYASKVAQLMQQTVAHLPRAEFDGVVDMLGERKHRIWLLGGRLTDPLAAYLCHHLKVVRADVVHLRGLPSSWADSLVDMGKHDVLVIFDIRRYWDGALDIAEMAAQRKVSVLLFTDQWLSPVSQVARYTLAAHTAGPSGWDSNTPLMLLVDAVIAAINTRYWGTISNRLQEVEAMRARLGEGSVQSGE
jgi:DNA-binding MurR/RpiR family transcriptional regulator